MNKLRVFFIALNMAFLLSNSLYATADINSILDDARISVEKAAAKGFEWTTTRKLIKDAEKALAAGDKDKSLQLAKAALNEAEKSLVQASYAETHWRAGIPL